MFDEQWQFAVEVERKYAKYRKKVMVRYDLSAAEVDVLLFLANNSQFDLAVDIVRVRKMQKSHVSLAVNKLCEKGYIQKETDCKSKPDRPCVFFERTRRTVGEKWQRIPLEKA